VYVVEEEERKRAEHFRKSLAKEDRFTFCDVAGYIADVMMLVLFRWNGTTATLPF